MNSTKCLKLVEKLQSILLTLSIIAVIVSIGVAQIEYNVWLNNDGGQYGTRMVSVKYNDTMPEATIPSKEGYVFGGYYSEKNGEGTQYYTADMTSARRWNIADHTTLYAYWIEETSITLTHSNFQDYFTISTTGKLVGNIASFTIRVSPKNTDYIYKPESSQTITLNLELSFSTSQYSNPIATEQITITLDKSLEYKAIVDQTTNLINSYDNIYWKTTILNCTGSIGK